ncbi:MAG: hypothetical protein NZM27_13970 [Acetobacteraceae bacterium]|nr:hypothetical protein [Acetobacteraceae bacterium]MDW8399189.1 hypothetical protein [Acetobacteraceae bacterium]
MSICYPPPMRWSLDTRIPLAFVADEAALAAALAAGPPAAVLCEAPPPPLPAGAVALVSFDATTTAHAAGCACCAGRSPAAAALDRLFQARVRNACPWFDRVLALADTPEAAEAIRETLARDPLASARFRLA